MPDPGQLQDFEITVDGELDRGDYIDVDVGMDDENYLAIDNDNYKVVQGSDYVSVVDGPETFSLRVDSAIPHGTTIEVEVDGVDTTDSNGVEVSDKVVDVTYTRTDNDNTDETTFDVGDVATSVTLTGDQDIVSNGETEEVEYTATLDADLTGVTVTFELQGAVEGDINSVSVGTKEDGSSDMADTSLVDGDSTVDTDGGVAQIDIDFADNVDDDDFTLVATIDSAGDDVSQDAEDELDVSVDTIQGITFDSIEDITHVDDSVDFQVNINNQELADFRTIEISDFGDIDGWLDEGTFTDAVFTSTDAEVDEVTYSDGTLTVSLAEKLTDSDTITITLNDENEANFWVTNEDSNYDLDATRSDNGKSDDANIDINVPAGTHSLSDAADETEIGASDVIDLVTVTIEDTQVAQNADDFIQIDISALSDLMDGLDTTDANITIDDTLGATLSAVLDGSKIKVSEDNASAVDIGESFTIQITGDAGNNWNSDVSVGAETLTVERHDSNNNYTQDIDVTLETANF